MKRTRSRTGTALPGRREKTRLTLRRLSRRRLADLDVELALVDERLALVVVAPVTCVARGERAILVEGQVLVRGRRRRIGVRRGVGIVVVGEGVRTSPIHERQPDAVRRQQTPRRRARRRGIVLRLE